MPYDPIERWESEGGAIWAGRRRAAQAEPPRRPDASREHAGDDAAPQERTSKPARSRRGSKPP